MRGIVNDINTVSFDLGILTQMVVSSFNDQEKLEETTSYIDQIAVDLDTISIKIKKLSKEVKCDKDLMLLFISKLSSALGYRVGIQESGFPKTFSLVVDTPDGQAKWEIDNVEMFNLPEYVGDVFV